MSESICVLCGRKMGAQTKPFWIIDPETLEVRGLAHSTCRDRKLDYDLGRQFSTRPAFWGHRGPVADPPAPGIIEFSAKMIRMGNSLPRWSTNLDFKVVILLGYTFKYFSVDELLSDPKIVEMFDWWANPDNQDMSQEDIDEIKRRLREGLDG